METLSKNKIKKCYRLNKMVCFELEKLVKEIGITETSFVEMAIIEKIARIQAKSEQDD